MKRRDAETPRENQVCNKVIGAAIEVHRILGPGLSESTSECVCYGLSRRELPFKRLVPVAVTDKGIKLAPVVTKWTCALRA